MPQCSVHLKIHHLLVKDSDPIPKAVAKVKRTYTGGQFTVMLACERCLSELRRMSSRYGFTIEVESFNRRVTDELRKDGVLS